MWSRAPLFRLAVAFFGGMYIYPMVSPIVVLIAAIALFSLFFLCQFYSTRIWSYHHRHEGGILIFAVVVFWGMLCGQINTKDPIELPAVESETVAAIKIIGAASERTSSIRYKGRIVGTKSEELDRCLGTHIWLYVKKDSSEFFKVGNTVAIESFPKAIQGPQNPGEFDFQAYSAGIGIYGMAYVKSDAIYVLDSTSQTSLFSSIREHMLQMLDNSSLGRDQLGVIKALAMGYKDDLVVDQKEDFARAGAMHVLAVSGLHVGLIYMVINALLRVPPGFRKLRLVKGIVVISVIWLYAGITDFSPSVLRSSTMFTFLVAGDLLGRKLSTLNSIAASAFFLVCLEPNIIHQLGFQLSYLAVCGIVIFQPFLASLISTRYKVIRWVWDLTCVSIAAQLFTLPLTLFYFGQFPVYGIFANIAIIPLATGTLYSSLLFALLPPIKWISKLLEVIVDYLSYTMLLITEFVSDLSGAQLQIQLSDRVEMLLLLSMVIALVLFVLTAKKIWLKSLVLIVSCIIVWPIAVKYIGEEEPLFCIHSFPKATCISIFGSGKGMLYAHESAYQDSVNIARKVKCGWTQLGMNWNTRRAQMLESGITQISIVSEGQFAVHTDGTNIPNQTLGLCYLIPHGDWKQEYSAQIKSDRRIVLDMSLSYWERENWISALAQMEISYWDVNKQGAMILTKTDIAAALEKYQHTSPISSN